MFIFQNVFQKGGDDAKKEAPKAAQQPQAKKEGTPAPKKDGFTKPAEKTIKDAEAMYESKKYAEAQAVFTSIYVDASRKGDKALMSQGAWGIARCKNMQGKYDKITTYLSSVIVSDNGITQDDVDKFKQAVAINMANSAKAQQAAPVQTQASPPVKTAKTVSLPVNNTGKKLSASDAKAITDTFSEDDTAVAHAYALLKEIVAKGDKATGSDKKYVAAAMEKAYGMADCFGLKDVGSDSLREFVENGEYVKALGAFQQIRDEWFAKSGVITPVESAGRKRDYYYLKDDNGTALHFANIAVKSRGHAEDYKGRGDIYRAMEKFDEAIADFTSCVDRGHTMDALFDLARTYAEAGKYKEAVENYEAAKVVGKKNFSKNMQALLDDAKAKLASETQQQKTAPPKQAPVAPVKQADPAQQPATSTAKPASTPAQQPVVQTQASTPPATTSAPVKSRTSGASAADLIKSAKFMPVEVDNVWADTKSAYNANNKLTGADPSPELTRAEANRQFSKILVYALENNWISDEQKAKLMKGEMPEGFSYELALLKAMLRVSTQRGGMWNVNEAFDAYSGKSLGEVLLALPEIAISMQAYDDSEGKAIKGKTIGTASAAFWTREFGAILAKEDVDTNALRAAIENANKKVEEKPKEVAGTLDTYTDIDIFKQDWRVMRAAEVLGIGLAAATEESLNGYKEDSGYSVGKIMAAASEKISNAPKLTVLSQANAGKCSAIEEIIGAVGENGTVPAGKGMLANPLGSLVQLGLLYEEDKRRDIKAKAGGEDVAIFRYNGKKYALSKEYMDAAKALGIDVDDANLKKQGKILVGKRKSDEETKSLIRGEDKKQDDAKNLLNDPVAQKTIKDKVVAGLTDLGMYGDGTLVNDNALTTGENIAISQYLEDGRLNKADGMPNTEITAGLAKIVGEFKYEHETNIATGSQIVMFDKDVSDAVGRKAEELANAGTGKTKNDYANDIVGHLNDNAASLKANKVMDKELVLAAISTYAVGEKQEEKKKETPKVKTALEAYQGLDEAGKKAKILEFAEANPEVGTAIKEKAGAALPDDEQSLRVGYLMSKGEDAIFKDDKSGMDAGKIVALLKTYDNAPTLDAPINVTDFGNMFLTETVALPKWFKDLENGEGDNAAAQKLEIAEVAQKLGDEKLTGYLKEVSADMLKTDTKYAQGAFTSVMLKAELDGLAGGAAASKSTATEPDDLLLADAVSQLESLVNLISSNGDAKQIADAKVQAAAMMEKVYRFSDYFGPKNVGSTRLKEFVAKEDYENALATVKAIDTNWNNAANPELATKKSGYYFRGTESTDMQNAVKFATAAIDADKSSDNYRARARLYESLKDYDKAIADMNAVVSLEPTYDFYVKDRGDIYFNAGKYAEALADYNLAKQLNPKGNYDGAIQSAQDALAKEGKGTAKATAGSVAYAYTKGTATNPAIDGLLDTPAKLDAVVDAMKTQDTPIAAKSVQQAIDEFVAYSNQPEQNAAFTKESVPDASSLAFQITVKWNREHAN